MEGAVGNIDSAHICLPLSWQIIDLKNVDVYTFESMYVGSEKVYDLNTHLIRTSIFTFRNSTTKHAECQANSVLW